MLIGKEWKIEADELQAILYRLIPAGKNVNRRTGEASTKDRWDIVGYYSHPRNALHALVDQGVRDTELKDFKTVVTKLDELHSLINTFNKSLK